MKNRILLSVFTGLLPVWICAQSQSSWVHQGPFSNNLQNGNFFETGRIDDICPDPNYGTGSPVIQTIYIGSGAAGLWKSTNGGTSWAFVPPDYAGNKPHLGGISAVAITPGAPGTEGEPIYVADIYGIDFGVGNCSGVYKYYPSTQSWQSTASFPGASPTFIINSIKIHPSNNQYIYVCSNEGLYQSTNGGTNWSKNTSIGTVNIRNIAFMPRTGGSGYPYFLYVSGTNYFFESSDDGSTFSHVSSMESLFGSYVFVYGNIAYTASASAPNEQYIYLYAAQKTSSNSTNYGLYRFTYDSNGGGSTSSAALVFYSEFNGDNSPDRIAVAANDKVAYIGGMRYRQYNSVSNSLSTFSALNSSLQTYVPHDDQHCLFFHKGTNQIMVACDGGFYRDSYTPANSPDNGVGTHAILPMNDGLHISQVNGFASSEADPQYFLTGEQDTKGFFSSVSNSTTFGSWFSETTGGLFDKYNPERVFLRHSSYNGRIGILDDFVTSPPAGYIGSTYDYNQTNSYTPSVSDFCTASAYTTMGAEFSQNTFFQDPLVQDRIYFGAMDALTQMCASSQLFIWKFRPYIVYSSTNFPSNPEMQVAPNQKVHAIAIPRANNNRLYFSNSAATPNYIAQIYRYVGTDINDTWLAHNEDVAHWPRITPDFMSTAIIPVPLTFAQTVNISYPGLAASDWDENKAWVVVRGFPDNITGNPVVKVLQFNNGTWTNMSTGIPADEVPFSLVYEQGSNDMLYLGTNRAVYFCHASDPSPTWQLFVSGSPQLPVVSVRQLQVNYTENKLWAGTYGHGVWSSPLSCPSQATLTETGTLSSSKFDEATQWVKGQNLTISNGNVKFRAGDYVELLPDFLVTAGSSTEFMAFIHGCSSPGNTFRATEESVYPVFEDGGEMTLTPEIPAAEELLTVIPNPSDGHFTLLKNTGEIMNVEIYDLMGKLVFKEESVAEKNKNIDLSQQPKGIYLLKASFGNTVKTIRVINQ